MTTPANGVARMHAAAQGTTITDAATIVPEPDETATEKGETVDYLASREIKKLLRLKLVERDKIASLKVAIAYLAVKNKLGSPFGGDLDNED